MIQSISHLQNGVSFLGTHLIDNIQCLYKIVDPLEHDFGGQQIIKCSNSWNFILFSMLDDAVDFVYPDLLNVIHNILGSDEILLMQFLLGRGNLTDFFIYLSYSGLI